MIGSLKRHKVVVYYAMLSILLVSFFLGVIALKGKSPTRTYSTVGDLSDITEIEAYQTGNGLSEVQINKSEKLIVNFSPAVNLVYIYVSQRVLDSKPNFILMEFGVYGVSDSFTYTIRMQKAGFTEERGFFYVPGPNYVFNSCPEGQLFRLKLLIHTLNNIEREGNPLDDCILMYISDFNAKAINANDIKRVEIQDLTFVKEEVGREATQPILLDERYVLLIFYVLLVLFILPILLLRLKKPSNLLFLIIAGFLLRILIAPVTSHAFDTEIWKFTGRKFYEEGEITLFTQWASPPSWYFTIIAFYMPYMLLRSLGLPDARVYYQPVLSLEVTFIKLPLILSDILCAFLIYKICQERNLDDKTSKLASAIYLFNPLSIYISSVWSMFDSLAVFFGLFGFYLCIKKRFYLSSMIWGLAVKWYSLGFIPVLSIYAYFKNREEGPFFRVLKSALIIFIGFGFFAFQLIFPYIIHGDITSLNQMMEFRLKTGGEASLVDFEGVTFWKLLRDIGIIQRPVQNFFLITFLPLYLILLALFFVHMKKLTLKGNNALPALNGTIIAVLLLFYLTYPQMNPQILLWILPHFILGCYLLKQIDALPIVIVSLVALNVLGDIPYHTVGFGIPGISLTGIPIDFLSYTISSLLIPIAFYFFLKLLSPSIYLKIGRTCKNVLQKLSLNELYVLYTSTVILTAIQALLVYSLALRSIYLLPLLVLTSFLQGITFLNLEFRKRLRL